MSEALKNALEYLVNFRASSISVPMRCVSSNIPHSRTTLSSFSPKYRSTSGQLLDQSRDSIIAHSWPPLEWPDKVIPRVRGKRRQINFTASAHCSTIPLTLAAQTKRKVKSQPRASERGTGGQRSPWSLKFDIFLLNF